jgi:hypothetical protein
MFIETPKERGDGASISTIKKQLKDTGLFLRMETVNTQPSQY